MIASSCNNDDDFIEPDPGYSYFPLDTNYFSDYLYSEVKYFLKPDTINNSVVTDSTIRNYIIRRVITTGFLDLEDDSAFRMEIFTKAISEPDWPLQPDSIAIIKIRNNELIYESNNRTFVKLIFPLKNGLSWNGNKFNSLGEEIYRSNNFGSSVELNDTTLSPSIKIEQSNSVNLIEEDIRSEEYVDKIGLARKNTRILQFRQSNGNVSEEIEKGKISSWELIDYGYL